MEGLLFFAVLLYMVLAIIMPKRLVPFFKSRRRLKIIPICLAVMLGILIYSISVHPPKEKPAPAPTTVTEQPKQETVTHELTAEKKDIFQVISSTVPLADNVAVGQMRDGIYEISFELDLKTSNDKTAKKKFAEVAKSISDGVAGKPYKIERISVVGMNKKSPIGLYTYTFPEFTDDGKPIYYFVNKNKHELFNP